MTKHVMDKITLIPHHINFTSDIILSSTIYLVFNSLFYILLDARVIDIDI